MALQFTIFSPTYHLFYYIHIEGIGNVNQSSCLRNIHKKSFFKKIIKKKISKLFSYWDLGHCKKGIPIDGRKPLWGNKLYISMGHSLCSSEITYTKNSYINLAHLSNTFSLNYTEIWNALGVRRGKLWPWVKCVFKRENVEVIITLMYLPECTECIQHVSLGHWGFCRSPMILERQHLASCDLGVNDRPPFPRHSCLGKPQQSRLLRWNEIIISN